MTLRRFMFIQQAEDAIAHTFNSLLGYDGNLSKDKIGLQTRTIQRGRAYDFDGANDDVLLSIDGGSFVSSGQFTIDLYAKATTFSNFPSLVHAYLPIANPPFFYSVQAGFAEIYFYMNNTSDFRIVRGTTPLGLGQERRITLSYDNTINTNNGKDRVKMFIDGVEETTIIPGGGGVLGSINTTSVPMTVGSGGGNYFFQGTMHSIRLFQSIETPESIDAGIPRYAQYYCDEGAGTTAYDSSGNARNGTLRNGVTHSALTTGKGADFQNQVGYTDYISYQGFSGYLFYTGSSINFGGDFSLHINVNSNNPTSINNRPISFGVTTLRVQLDNSSGTTEYRLLFSNNNNISFNLNIFPKTTFQKITIVKQGTTWTCYENGIQKSSFVFLFNASTSRTNIGTETSLTGLHDGNIERIGVWTRALTLLEVSSLQDISNSVPTGAIFDLKFNNNIVNSGTGGIFFFSGSLIFNTIKIPRDETIPIKDVLNNTLQYTGRVKYDAQPWGRYYSFDGVNDYYNTGVGILGLGAFTIHIDVRGKTNGGSYNSFLIQRPAVIPVATGIYQNEPLKNVTFNWNIAGLQFNFQTTFSGQDNVWRAYTMTYDGSFVRYYADGQLLGQTARTGTVTSGGTFYVGSDFLLSGRYVKADYADIRIYNRCLLQNEVEDIDKGEIGDTTGLLRKDNCDTGSGTLAYNAMGGTTATLMNGIMHGSEQGSGSISRQRYGHSSMGTLFGGSGSTTTPNNTTLTMNDVGGDIPFEVETYINTTSTASMQLFAKSSASANGEYYIVFASGLLFFRCVDQNTGGFIGRTAALPSINTRAKIKCIYDGSGTQSGLDIQYNGISVATGFSSVGTYTRMRDTGQPIKIGIRDSQRFVGYMKYFRVRKNGVLVLDYDFTNLSLLDLSGNGNNGAISGTLALSNGALPRNESNPTQDVLGNPLQYVGDNQSLLPGGRVNFDTAPAPELIRKGVDQDYIHGDTLPVTMTKTVDGYKEKDFIIPI